MSDKVLVSRDGYVLTLTLNRPKQKNALDLEMYDALTAALGEATSDPGVRVVLLRGEGGAFCAGNDLGDFLANPPTGQDAPVLKFLKAVTTFTKPLVAAVDGAAVGIGTTVLLHCDYAVSTDRAVFLMPFVQLGIVPEAGSTLLVPEMIGHRRAVELMMLGERFGAEDAARYGFVNKVVSADELDAAAQKAVARFAALPPQAVRMTKALLRRPNAEALQEVVALEGDTFIDRLGSGEAKEAMSAFLEKRKPDFSQFS